MRFYPRRKYEKFVFAFLPHAVWDPSEGRHFHVWLEKYWKCSDGRTRWNMAKNYDR